MADEDEFSPGRLFIEAFLDKNLVGFDECRTHYEGMTPDELANELAFLFSKPVTAIAFDFSGSRYYAFLVALVQCAASFRDLTNDQRSKLVNMAIDARDYVRSRTEEGKRKALEEAISTTLRRIKIYELYPTVSDLVSKGMRDYVGHFPANPVWEVLEEQDGKFVIPNDQVCAIFFNDSAESADAIRAYLRADGDPLSLEDYGGYLLRQSGVIAGDGSLDFQKLTAWEQRYASALSVLPGLQSKLDVAREAQERVERAIADKEAALDYIRLSPAMLYVEHDPMTATEKLFALPDTAEAMCALLERMAGNREAFEGLQKCVIDYIVQKVGVTHDRAAQYITFIHTHERALAELFDETKMQTFRNVAEDLRRCSMTPALEPEDIQATRQNAPSRRSWWQRLFPS